MGNNYGSWAPTSANPCDGRFSAQFTTYSDATGYGRYAYVYLANTLSNLCPGSSYSISYYSSCVVPDGGSCSYGIWTADSPDDEEFYATKKSGTGWLSNDNVFEFTPRSSTERLYVYVATALDNPGDGNIYLDDFSISLLGNEEHSISDGL